MVFKENAEAACPKGRAVFLEVVPKYHKAQHSPLGKAESPNNWETHSVRMHQFKKRLSGPKRWPDPGILIHKTMFSSLPVVQHGSVAGPQATTGLQKKNTTNLLLSLAEGRMWMLAKIPILCLHTTYRAHSHTRQQKNRDNRLISP